MSLIEGTNVGNFTGTTEVELLAGPASGRRITRFLSVYNLDTAAVTLTLRFERGGNDFVVTKVILEAGETLIFDHLLVFSAATDRLTAVLGGAVTSAQPQFVVTYAEVS